MKDTLKKMRKGRKREEKKREEEGSGARRKEGYSCCWPGDTERESAEDRRGKGARKLREREEKERRGRTRVGNQYCFQIPGMTPSVPHLDPVIPSNQFPTLP